MDDLPDEVLLQILQYVTPFELSILASLNTRYEKLILERSLWTHINCRGRFATVQEADFYIEQIHPETKMFLINIAPTNDPTTRQRIEILTLEEKLSYTMLTVLALEGIYFNGKCVPLQDYPPSLEEVSFNESLFSNANAFFRHASQSLRQLRVITLEHCLSLGGGILISLGNFPALEIISLNGCMGVRDEFVALSLDTRTSFPQLKCLDVRCTALGGDMLQAAAKMRHLGELYFHNYFHYVREAPSLAGDLRPLNDLLRYRLVDMTTKEGIVEAEDSQLVYQYEGAFDDDMLSVFAWTLASGDVYTAPASVLYKRPYADACTCSWDKPRDKSWLDIITPHLRSGQHEAANGSSAASAASTSLPRKRRCTDAPEPATEPSTSTDASGASSSGAPPRKHKRTDRSRWFLAGPDEDPVSWPRPSAPNGTTQTPPSGGGPIATAFQPYFRLPNGREIRGRAPKERALYEQQALCVYEISLGGRRNDDSTAAAGDAAAVGEQPPPPRPPPPPIPVIFPRGSHGIVMCCFGEPQRHRRVTSTLRQVSLRGVPHIVDGALSHLQYLNLDLLDLTGTQVTAAGVALIRRYMPHCRVLHETACRCRPR